MVIELINALLSHIMTLPKLFVAKLGLMYYYLFIHLTLCITLHQLL